MARRKASGSTAQIAFICTTEAFWIKTLSGLAAIVSGRGEEGGAATSYADEMLIRQKVNEFWTRTNQPGGRQTVGMRRQLHSSASLRLFILPFLFFLLSYHPSHLPPSLFYPSFRNPLIFLSFFIHPCFFLSFLPSSHIIPSLLSSFMPSTPSFVLHDLVP